MYPCFVEEGGASFLKAKYQSILGIDDIFDPFVNVHVSKETSFLFVSFFFFLYATTLF